MNQKIIYFLLIFFLFFQVILASDYYRQVFHNTDPEAKCLDGSPTFLYLHEGGDLENFLIFFVGGGSCGSSSLSQTI